MMVFLVYLLKVNLAVALFYACYRVLFREDTFLLGRRLALLGLMAAAVGYPFIEITARATDYGPLWRALLSGTAPVYMLPEVVVLGSARAAEVSLLDRWPELLLGLYGLAAAGLLVRILIQTGAIAGFVIRSQVVEQDGTRVHQCRGMQTPFSFFRWIVLDMTRYTDTELREILRHEETHVREGHSFDILLAELLCAMCWLNPFAWLLKREIRLNLEFLADRSVLASGYEAEHYQFHLLRLTYHKATAKIVNSFNVSLLKKRIFMMNKKQTSKLSIVKYTLLVPVVGMLVFFNTALRMQAGSVESTGSNVWVETLTAVEASDVPGLDFQAPPPPPLKKEAKKEPKEKVIVRDLVQKETDEPKKNGSAYDYAEEMPNFPGGDKAMTKFLFDNMQYPVVAQESNIQGRVIVRFVVADDGSITDVEIKQSLHPVCDAEAIRVVKKMPKWTPGKIKGQVVAVYYTLPILFKLSGGEKKDTTPTPLKDGIYSLNGKNISISGDHIIVSEDSITVSRMVPQRDTPLRTVSDEVVVMIDGKVVPNTELNALDPNSIENITVLKEPKPGRVIITLKK